MSVEKYTLKDGSTRWLVRYDTYEGSIRKQHKRKGFKSERAANTFNARVKVQIDDRLYIEKDNISFGAYCEEYIRIYCQARAPKTVQGYKIITKTLNDLPLGKIGIQRVTPEDLEQHKNHLRQQGKSERTILNHMLFIGAVLKRAKINRKIKFNPMEEVEKPRPQKHEHIILTVEQYRELLQAAKHHPLYIPVILAGCMGLRRGEALGLRWTDIDFKAKTITIRQTRQVIDREEIIGPPKSGTSKRILHMPEFVARELLVHKNYIVLSIQHQLVCCTSDGEPISINTFNQRFERLLRKTALPQNLRYHDLRHTSAAIMTAAGASPKEVSDYLGHSSIDITMNLYAGVFDENKKKTAKKIDDMISL